MTAEDTGYDARGCLLSGRMSRRYEEVNRMTISEIASIVISLGFLATAVGLSFHSIRLHLISKVLQDLGEQLSEAVKRMETGSGQNETCGEQKK